MITTPTIVMSPSSSDAPRRGPKPASSTGPDAVTRYGPVAGAGGYQPGPPGGAPPGAQPPAGGGGGGVQPPDGGGGVQLPGGGAEASSRPMVVGAEASSRPVAVWAARASPGVCRVGACRVGACRVGSCRVGSWLPPRTNGVRRQIRSKRCSCQSHDPAPRPRRAPPASGRARPATVCESTRRRAPPGRRSPSRQPHHDDDEDGHRHGVGGDGVGGAQPGHCGQCRRRSAGRARDAGQAAQRADRPDAIEHRGAQCRGRGDGRDRPGDLQRPAALMRQPLGAVGCRLNG